MSVLNVKAVVTQPKYNFKLREGSFEALVMVGDGDMITHDAALLL